MKRDYPLPTGILHLECSEDPDPLLSVWARENAQRPFLFVSKILGKHLPVPVATLRHYQRQLAAQLPPLPAPLFVGMAETATALGWGIFEHYPYSGARYLASTRYRLAQHSALSFTEAHSHAPALYLHRRPWLSSIRSLVIVDDELSTGNTARALVCALQAEGLALEKVILVSLTDFAPPLPDFPCPVTRLSLLRGHWSFTPHPERRPAATPKAQAAPVVLNLPDYNARLGTTTKLAPPPLPPSTARKILVLGMGEFMYPPLVLAEALAARGHEVRFCATTRSPIATTPRYCWPDPYGEGIPHYFYPQAGDEDARFLVSELAPNAVLRQMARDLDAQLIHYGAAL